MIGTKQRPAPATRVQRTYSAADRVVALTAVVAAGGNVRRAACETGVPARTLAGWRAAARADPVPAPADLQLTPDLTAAVEAALTRLLAVLTPDNLSKAPLSHLAKLIGSLADVLVLLREHAARPANTHAAGGCDLSKLSDEQLGTLDELMRIATPDSHDTPEGA